MNLLIRDVLLVTVNAQDEVVQGDLLVREGEIVSVGPRVDPAAARVDRVIEGRGFIAIPGLVNAHCHLASYLFKGTHYDRPLEIWRQYGRAARRTPGDRHLYAGALMACLEMLRSGTTTVLDHHYAGVAAPFMGAESITRALRDSGMRAAMALTIADRAYEDTVPLDATTLDEAARREAERISAFENREGLEDCQRFLDAYRHVSPLLSPMIGPSAPQRCSDALLLACRELAERYGVGLHMHLLETRTQAVQCQRLYGTSAVRHLAAIGFLNPRLSTPHSVWVEEDDLPLLAEHGVVPVHNPASNLRLGSGLAKVPAMLRQGIAVALGTDGAPSNDTQNMFDAVRLAGLIHNPGEPDYERWLTPQQVLRMAAMGGARACQLAERCGSLEPGKRADVVLLRRGTPAFTPLNDVYGQLVYCENGSSVDSVLVDGRVVVEGGRSTLVDEAALTQEVEALRRELDPLVDEETERTRALEPSLRAMYLGAVAAFEPPDQG